MAAVRPPRRTKAQPFPKARRRESTAATTAAPRRQRNMLLYISSKKTPSQEQVKGTDCGCRACSLSREEIEEQRLVRVHDGHHCPPI